MRFRFDAHLAHQREAIDAVLDLFVGGESSLPHEETLLENLHRVQHRAGLERSERLEGREFTIDMETGTGKTYVYLRTLHELVQRHGVSRAVVVVPSVAIREGVLQQIRATREHFAELYGGARITEALYDPGSPNLLERFAHDPGLQVLVINMDAFNKGWANLIHRPHDALRGRRPIDLIAASEPVVILDEPQNLDGPSTRRAVEELGASVTLRYSATHRRAPHLVYRLDPVRAYDLRLVKHIEVIGVTEEDAERVLVDVLEVKGHRTGVRAKIAIEALVDGVVERRVCTVRGAGEELFELSGGREIYRGWVVDALDVDREAVLFAGGRERRAGGVDASHPRTAIMKRQVEETIREHLELSLRLSRLRREGEGIKVLSLFFIERVAHYATPEAPLRSVFESTYGRLAAEPRYAGLSLPRAGEVHAGYFARRKDVAVDTRGRSREDGEAYELIMRDKARLLDRAEPVQFIFSHSALREGWDNPNVFQICTLHPTRSELRKRQEIGRGLRLPVDERGTRVSDPDLARLVVVANERYERFARQLQREYREDHAVELGDRIVDRRAPRPIRLREGWKKARAFDELWARIGRRIPFNVNVDSPALIRQGGQALKELPAHDRVRIQVERVRREGSEIERVEASVERSEIVTRDPVSLLQRETALTRVTLVAILREAGVRARDLSDPERLSMISARLRELVSAHLCVRATYDTSSATAVSASLFEDRPLRSAGRRVQPVERSTHDALPVESDREARWLAEVDEDPRTDLVVRWPSWLPISTPAGDARPAWAVLREGELTIVGREAVGGEATRTAMAAWCESIGARWTSGFDGHEA